MNLEEQLGTKVAKLTNVSKMQKEAISPAVGKALLTGGKALWSGAKGIGNWLKPTTMGGAARLAGTGAGAHIGYDAAQYAGSSPKELQQYYDQNQVARQGQKAFGKAMDAPSAFMDPDTSKAISTRDLVSPYGNVPQAPVPKTNSLYGAFMNPAHEFMMSGGGDPGPYKPPRAYGPDGPPEVTINPDGSRSRVTRETMPTQQPNNRVLNQQRLMDLEALKQRATGDKAQQLGQDAARQYEDTMRDIQNRQDQSQAGFDQGSAGQQQTLADLWNQLGATPPPQEGGGAAPQGGGGGGAPPQGGGGQQGPDWSFKPAVNAQDTQGMSMEEQYRLWQQQNQQKLRAARSGLENARQPYPATEKQEQSRRPFDMTDLERRRAYEQRLARLYGAY